MTGKRDVIKILCFILFLFLYFCIISTTQSVVAYPPVTPLPDMIEVENTLAEGLMEIRGHRRHVTPKYANRLVEEVKKVTSKDEYSWMSPELLLGVAINESDLRPNLIVGYDCGITQNRVTIFTKSRKNRTVLCRKLATSTKRSFIYAAKELTEIKDRYCVRQWKRMEKARARCKEGDLPCAVADRTELAFTRCALNSYNQGPRFFREENCEEGERRCIVRARYWQRVLCFATGVRLGRTTQRNCRAASSIEWIAKAYGISVEEVVTQ